MQPPETDPAAWIRRALTDLRVARLAAADPDLPPWPAGFHLQQAAEKALKAVIVARGRAAPRTHDLFLLGEAAEELEPAMTGWADRLVGLTEFGVVQRYPGIAEPPLELATALAELDALISTVQRVCSES